MTDTKTRDSFFSVAFDLLLIDQNLPYDLYINSSGNKSRDKFVRIFPKNGRLSKDDVATFKEKYHQLYILEKQRDLYLKSLVQCTGVTVETKTEVIKESAIVYLNKLFDKDKEFNTDILEEAIEGCQEAVESMIDVVEDYNVHQVKELIGNLSFHDFYTYDHSINVSMYSITIFKELKPHATRDELVMAGLGGLLHDLGKIKIPTQIINNPGKLSDEEFDIIKKHPDYGIELLDEHHFSGEGVDFNIIKRVIHEHHENVDGTGYPNKIEGKDIHILARVTAIADFFDAITTKRSYHDVLTTEEALGVMSRSVGKKIDPKIFEVFTNNVNKLTIQKQSNKELPSDFDPCQPHNVLPFQTVKPSVQQEDFFKKEKQDFGKVSVDGEEEKDKKKKAS